MHRKLMLTLALSAVFMFALNSALACTIFIAEGNGLLLAGNNEEHDDPNGEVRFKPASEGKYGTVTFAFGPFTQGGMNEKGLFFDCFAPNAFRLPPWQQGQLLPGGTVPDRQPTMEEMWQICTRYDVASKQMLEECATVDEAIDFYQRHYEASFGYANIMVADNSGASAVITWDWEKNEIGVTRKAGSFQVIGIGRDTIFPRISSGSFEVSMESIRDLLRDTSIDATAYSYICDLKQGTVYVYNRRGYENPMQFSLKTELAKGSRSFFLKELFAKP